jgi:hypothetical protein
MGLENIRNWIERKHTVTRIGVGGTGFAIWTKLDHGVWFWMISRCISSEHSRKFTGDYTRKGVARRVTSVEGVYKVGIIDILGPSSPERERK